MECQDQRKYGHPYKRDYNTKCTRKKHFSFKRLEEICDKEVCLTVFEISNKNNGFIDLFEQNNDPDWSCENDHPCEKKCVELCGDCIVPMNKILPCSHQIKLPCFVDSEQYKCNEKVEIILSKCKHKITKYCHEKNPDCIFKCTDRLECGHSCELNCHKNNDPEHEKYICKKPCSKINITCSQNHKHKKLCYEDCSICSLRVDKILKCGHLKKNVYCGADISIIECSKHLPCNRILECGHKCKKKCYEECISCEIIVIKLFSECGHKMEIECQKNPDRKIVCSEKCTKTLNCGHKCKDLCGNQCSSDNCKELVLKENKSPACGHNKMWVFCCDVNKGSCS